MGQITLYLDNETAARMKSAAEAEGVSQSKWVVRLIRQKTVSQWPENVVSLAGTWTDLPNVKSLRETEETSDLNRESL